MVRPQLSESKAAARLEQTLQPSMYENGDNSSSERIDGTLTLFIQTTIFDDHLLYFNDICHLIDCKFE